MPLRLLLAAGIAAVAMAAAPVAAPAQQKAAAAQKDWSRTIARTPEGGYRMGNPDAPIKLVEFVSLTCPACALFASESKPALAERYVRSGRVSLELRNFVLNPIDLTAAMLARCAPLAAYFPMTEALLAQQRSWAGRVHGLSREQISELEALPDRDRLVRIAEITGLDRIAAAHGLAAAQVRPCLADPRNLEQIVRLRQDGESFRIEGTPSFLINGRKVEAHDWAAIEPLLRPPGR